MQWPCVVVIGCRHVCQPERTRRAWQPAAPPRQRPASAQHMPVNAGSSAGLKLQAGLCTLVQRSATQWLCQAADSPHC
jgi:hypothetical protein